MRRWQMRPITKRLLFWFFIAAVVPVLALGFGILRYSNESLQRSALHNLENVSDKKSEQIEAALQEYIMDIKLLAHSPLTVQALKAFQEAYTASGTQSEEYLAVNQAYKQHFEPYVRLAGFHDIFLISAEGDIIFTVQHEDDFGSNLMRGPFSTSRLATVVRQALSNASVSISDFQYYSPSLKGAAFVAAPLMEKGTPIGVVALQFNNERLVELLQNNTGLGGSARTIVGRLEGGQIVQLDRELVMPHIEGVQRAPLGLLASPLSNAAMGENGTGVITHHDESVVAVWRFLPTMKWGLVVSMDASEVFAPAKTLFVVGSVVIVGVLLIAIGIAGYLGQSVAGPLNRLTLATEMIARGDFRLIDEDGEDELGRLAKAFNSMVIQIQRSRHSIETVNIGLEHRVKERTSELESTNTQLQNEVKERAKAENSLRLSAAVYENTSDSVVITDPSGRIIEANRAYCSLTGFDRASLLGQVASFANPSRHDPKQFEAIWETVRRSGWWRGEVIERNEKGEAVPMWLTLNALKDLSGTLTHYIGILFDISPLKRVEHQLTRLAYFDSMTGLPNRLMLREKLTQRIDSIKDTNDQVAVLFIDLDGFKAVNDTYGHRTGDDVLIEVAVRLNRSLRENDFAARLGGDEFTVITGTFQSTTELGDFADRIIEQLSSPLLIDKPIRIGASIGISICPHDGLRPEDLFRMADVAMYAAKQAGKGKYRFFSKDMAARPVGIPRSPFGAH